ncbi:hypothetical protein, conserved [Eimeria maxima]|uniref:Uncharacterized protein n=1 Tax=Eimeria maxima TaxID=5804 RepID=U6M6H7_EIMMA|nr:hypothetical protein, conserved [Eimeria maxima]CDJ58039.1 hypothetical protein, conserved [Eimeria maxima]
MNVGARIFGAQFGIYTFKSYLPIIAAVIVAAVVGEIAHNARMKRRQIEEFQRLSRLRRLVRRQRKRRDLALLKAREKARRAAARMAAHAHPHYTYVGRTHGHDVWRLTPTASAGPTRHPPPRIGATIRYGGGMPSAHYFKTDEELDQAAQTKESEGAASPAARMAPLRDKTGLQVMSRTEAETKKGDAAEVTDSTPTPPVAAATETT